MLTTKDEKAFKEIKQILLTKVPSKRQRSSMKRQFTKKQ